MSTTTTTNVATLTGMDALSVLASTMEAEVVTLKSSQSAHLKSLHSLDTPESFLPAFSEAVTEYRDGSAYSTAAEAGRKFAASADALNAQHIAFRVSLVSEYRRVFPNAGVTTIALAITGSKANAGVKMISRDVANLKLVEANRAAIEAAEVSGATKPERLSLASAAKVTRTMDATEVGAAIERVRKGQPVVDPATEVVALVKWSTIVGAVERVMDRLSILESNPTPEQRDAMLGTLQRIATRVSALKVTEVTAEVKATA